jgi:hypothetical protein
MSIEAMKQALEALDGLSEPYDVLKAQHALRTAIEQAEKQEPVAWANINKHGDITHTNNKRMPWSKTPLYTTPPAQPATQEPVAWLGLEQSDMPDGDDPMYDHDFFLKGMVWADATLRKKNATPPAAQSQWVGFTEEEINEYDYEHRDFIYDIEALLKHKNTRLG